MTDERRVTRQIRVGDVPVGGGAPVTVQSMTITKTADVDGTLAQVYALVGAGADIVRITCNDVEQIRLNMSNSGPGISTFSKIAHQERFGGGCARPE